MTLPTTPFYSTMSSTSRFESLPIELWSEIFHHCLPAHSHSRLRSSDAPLVLLRVCSSWSSIALSTPRLWSSIRIFLEDGFQWDPLPILKLFLDRSRDTPLSITIDYHTLTPMSQTSYMAVMTRIFSSIQPHARRWHSLSITATSACIAALHEQGNVFPSLRSLKVDSRFFIHEPISGDLGSRLPFVSEMARLKVLKLKPSAVYLPSLEECRQLLAEAVDLEDCTLHAQLDATRQAEQSIVKTPVKKLRMVFHDDMPLETSAIADRVSSFFTALECPNVEDLRIVRYGGNRDSGDPITPFFSSPSILPSIFHKLRSLRLSGLPLHNVDLLHIIDSLPQLKTLDLLFDIKDAEADPVWDNVLSALTAGESLSLPSLQSLRIECTGAHCSDEALQTFLHHRTSSFEGSRTAFKFKFLCTRPISSELYRAAEGLSVHHITLTSLPM